jgi:plasmid stabilization system protein ParE
LNYRVRFTAAAREDLRRLFEFLAENDLVAAERAYDVIEKAFDLLAVLPFTCRKAIDGDSPFLRELIISFGSGGYVALFEIEDRQTVTVLAVRHQREDDYH